MAAGLIATLTASLTACADGKAAQEISNDLDVVDAAASSGTDAAGAADADQGVLDQARAVVCDTDRTTLLTAIEAFSAVEGRPPTDETELVGVYLREPSSSWDIAPDGSLVPAAGSTCT